MRSEDLAPLLAAQPEPGIGFRQGRVLAWNPETAQNEIDVAGSTMVDLPILNTNEALLIGVGSIVGIVTFGSSWFILGRITIPGTPDAASALSMVSSRYVTSVIRTLEASTSTTYADLATVGPRVTVRVGASGKLLLTASANINYVSAPGGTDGGALSVAVAGATTIAAGLTFESYDVGSAGIAGAVYSRIGTIHTTTLLTGLNPGEHTVTMRYASYVGRSVGWMERVLVALPM